MGIGIDFDFSSFVDIYDIGSSVTYTFEEDSDSSGLGTLIASRVRAEIIYENGKPRVFVDMIPNIILNPRGSYKVVSKFDTYTSVSIGQIIDNNTITGYDIQCE